MMRNPLFNWREIFNTLGMGRTSRVGRSLRAIYRRLISVQPCLAVKHCEVQGKSLFLHPCFAAGWRENYESKLFVALKGYGKGCELLVDVGAYIGIFTIVAAHIFAGARIVAFEPLPENYFWLKHHVHRNKLHKRTRLFRKALSERASKTTIFDGKDRSQASLRGDHSDGPVYEVYTATLDEMAEKVQLLPGSRTMIKVDVEGAEFLVLRGAKEVLGKYRPIVLLELHPYAHSQFGYKTEELIDYLGDLRYKLVSCDGHTVTNFPDWPTHWIAMPASPE